VVSGVGAVLAGPDKQPTCVSAHIQKSQWAAFDPNRTLAVCPKCAQSWHASVQCAHPRIGRSFRLAVIAAILCLIRADARVTLESAIGVAGRRNRAATWSGTIARSR
jgi:hypothetical protein